MFALRKSIAMRDLWPRLCNAMRVSGESVSAMGGGSRTRRDACVRAGAVLLAVSRGGTQRRNPAQGAPSMS
jgi:hypothetical protein